MVTKRARQPTFLMSVKKLDDESSCPAGVGERTMLVLEISMLVGLAGFGAKLSDLLVFLFNSMIFA